MAHCAARKLCNLLDNKARGRLTSIYVYEVPTGFGIKGREGETDDGIRGNEPFTVRIIAVIRWPVRDDAR